MANPKPDTSGLKRGGSPGRPVGTPNKLTTAAKTAIEQAALGLGGVARLTAWAAEDPLNERAFWTQIYTKLLPLQVTDGEGKPVFPPGGIAFLMSVDPEAKNRT